MAECQARRRIKCRFQSRGFCRDGGNCPFAHNEPNSITVPEHVCLYYLGGKCFFGASCRNSHVEPSELVALTEQANNSNNAANQEQGSDGSSPDLNECQSISGQPSQTGKVVVSKELLSDHETGEQDLLASDKLSTGSHRSRTSSCSSTTASINASSKPSSRTPAARLVPFTKCTSLSLSKASEHSPTDSASNTAAAKPTSWAQAVRQKEVRQKNEADLERLKRLPLCPFGVSAGVCPDNSCNYIHGDKCDMCYRLCLHPHNEAQRQEHHEECVREHERQMELSFAIQRSSDKACGICMDTVMEKEPPTERRFGILEKCSHIFCLSCIRKWRQTKQFDNRTIRACPECRTSSDFVVPSRYWVDDKEEKDKLIDSYKQALSKKHCKYFKNGRGDCPFAGACFYLHAYPDGRKATMPLPGPPRQRRRQNNDGDIETLRDMLLWNYLEVRDGHRDQHHWITLDIDDMMDMQDMAILSETDDESDWSDYGILTEW